MVQAEDYARFVQMLVGTVVCHWKTPAEPAHHRSDGSNDVGTLYSGTVKNTKGLGFGLTVDVVLDQSPRERPTWNGHLAWGGGAFGTYFWVDRRGRELVGVIMVQRSVAQLADGNLQENAVMQAIVD